MRIHFIAIGGSAMHNIAIALHENGHTITGSDDKIFNPSKDRLKKIGLLPKKTGWFPEKNISENLDAIILGMHAKQDNPEIKKARELSIPIYSFPEYIYEQSKGKKRIVIAGSHGKTSITAMILHVLKKLKINCDYMVGAQIDGFKTMFKITQNAPIIILEGDEYLSSSIDKRPKFHLYKPHIAVLSGIAWDHINVFPSYDIYVEQFRIFKDMVEDTLIYCSEDKEVVKLINEGAKCNLIPYKTPKHSINNGVTSINGHELIIFGKHNLQNLNAAKLICNELGISDTSFYKHIQTFKGAKKRLELIKKHNSSYIYKDFAHSPSKLKATILAMKEQYYQNKLVACLELHTFSSLNYKFLHQYSGCMNLADIAIIYFNLKELKNKNLKKITENQIKESFDRNDIKVFTNSQKMQKYLNSLKWEKQNLLMMSSGNFNDIDLNQII